MDILLLLQYLRDDQSDRQIQRALGLDRRTISKYRRWAAEQGLLCGPLPSIDQLQACMAQTLHRPPPPQNTSSVAPYQALVKQLRGEGVEIAALYQRLQERGYTGSYSAVYRFVRRLEPSTPEVPVRVETAPGEEAQLDFGYAGRLLDPVSKQGRKAWAFVMTLSWSRHQYVEFVFDQSVATWLRLHQAAFAFFGGVPRRLVIDNLKAAVLHADVDAPQIQPSYTECAAHYGFRIAPCRPRTPQHKGKVEKGGIHYLKRNFLAGRAPTSLSEANQAVQVWCIHTAGQRTHGTTQKKPWIRFCQTEKARLQPLPATAYERAEWKTAKVYRDGYVVWERAYYSVPFRLVHQTLRLRATAQQVQLYTLDYQRVGTHSRATHPGQRLTHPDHLPDHKRAGVLWQRPECVQLARQVGPHLLQVVEYLLADAQVERLPVVRKLLRLKERFDAPRLEAACARALHFGDPAYKTIKRILVQGLEHHPLCPVSPPRPARTFVRSAQELVGHLWGGRQWN